jgi:hypothetical protein
VKSLRQWAVYCHYCLVSLFIITYLGTSILWIWVTGPEVLRPPASFLFSLRSYLTPLTCLTGWEQSWAFFSPNINTENSYTLLAITLKNGLVKLVELPRMEELKFRDKLQHERYRKLYNDNMSSQTYGFFRSDIARFMSRANNEPDNPPVRTTFFLISNAIPPPYAGITPANGQTPTVHGKVEKYFVYRVEADDL